MMGYGKRLAVALVIVTILFLPGCTLSSLSDNSSMNDSSFKSYWFTPDGIPQDTTPEDTNISYSPEEREGYRIGSYNVQIFGKTKANNVPVVKGLAQVINDYDVLAFQEIRDISETAFPEFMEDYLPQYRYQVSERLGRTSSKEQYAWIWSDRVRLEDFLVYPDVDDVFEREPYAAYAYIGDETYVLIQVHTKPTQAEQEIAALVDVVEWAEVRYNDDDIILLGDMNADNYYYDGDDLKIYDEYITDDMDTTTTRTDAAYDRIYVKSDTNCDIEGYVDHYEDDGINEELAMAMSDHFLVGILMVC